MIVHKIQIDPLQVSSKSEALGLFLRQRLRTWFLTGVVVFAGLMAASLLFVPQSFSSRLSLSFVASTGGANGLFATMSGLTTSPASKYIGVIRSRSFATAIEKQVGLQALYGLPSEDEAIDMIMRGLSVTDSTRDGLLYISLSLPGPPRLAPGASQFRSKVRAAVARATNLYADRLRNYLTTSDMDSDAILLQAAGRQIRQARQAYDAATERLMDFARLRGAPIGSSLTLPERAGSASGSGSSTRSASGSDTDGNLDAGLRELQTLYAQRATLESEIASTEAALDMGARLQENQLSNVGALPSEDPLLTAARAAVNAARTRLDNLQIQYGPAHPRVIAERERLRLAEAKLQEQIQTVRKGYTTDRVEAQVRLDALKTKYATVKRQIAEAEQKTQKGREYSTEFERLRNEVTLRLEVLKAAASQAATLSMQVVSAQNRMRVVDSALPPKSGSPGMLKLGLMCGFLTLALLAGWAQLEFMSLWRTAVTRQRIVHEDEKTQARDGVGAS